MSGEGQQYLARHSIILRPRAPGQHARMIERRGAILRHAMHCTEEQLIREGVTVTFPQLLAQALYCGNALVSHGGATPYQARLGTQPRVLPDITMPSEETDSGPGRSMRRVREVALQRIVEATAIERINRALRTHTTCPGEVRNYKPGDTIDFYRKPGQKDLPGWNGPARVIRNVPARGQVVAS